MRRMPEGGKQHNIILLAVALGALTLAVFWPVTGHDFIAYDDPDYVTENPHIQSGLNGDVVRWAFTSGYAGNWHPLTWLSHALDVSLFGFSPAGHHAINLALHAVNVVLVFLLLRSLTGAVWRSALVAALFAVHPLRVESVAWVSERKDVLCACFGLLALLAYAKYAQLKIQNEKLKKGEGRRARAESGKQKAEMGQGLDTSPGNTSSGLRPPSPQRGEGNLPDRGGEGGRDGRPILEDSGAQRSDAPYLGSSSIFHPLSSRWYWLALACFALGLMSKPMLVTWPFVMLLLDVWPLKRARRWEIGDGSWDRERQSTPHPDTPHPASGHLLPSAEKGISPSEAESALKDDGRWKMALVGWKPLVVEKLPFFALAVASCVVTYLVQQRSGAVGDFDVITPGQRVSHAIVAYVQYLQMMVWPTGLAPFYPYADTHRQLPLAAAAAVLAIVSWLVWRQVRARPYLATGWLWYLGTLVPVIGLIQVGGQSVADRYTYLPGLGLLVAVVWGAAELATTIAGLRKPLAVAGALVVGALAWQAHTQVGYWRNTFTLFTHTLAVTERNHIAHQNVGIVLAAEGKVAEAEPHFAEAARLRPNFAEAFSNLGLSLAYQGKLDAAIENYQKALAIDPRLERVHFNLGRAYSLQGKPELALPAYEQAVQLNPGYYDARLWRAITLAELNQLERAEAEFRELVRALPGEPDAHFYLANVLAARGKNEDAILEYEAALRGKPDHADAHAGLGMLRAQRNETDDALRHFEEAARLEPNALNFQHLALAQVVKGDRRSAVSNYRKALELQPNWVDALNDLAWQLATAPEDDVRNGVEAVRLAERVNELTQQKEARCWGTLDAAYAEAGRFEDAVRAAEKCRELATAKGQQDIAEAAEQRRKLYEERKPFRQAASVQE